MKVVSVLLLCVCFSALQDFAYGKDPSYSAQVSVPILFKARPNSRVTRNVAANFKVVNVLWLKYLRQEKGDKSIYVYVKNLPKTFNGVTITRNNYNTYKNIIGDIIVKTIKTYTSDVLNVKPVSVFLNRVDPRGVDVKISETANVNFNRTIIVSFEDPPYGQSLPNRFVTNRNLNWKNSTNIPDLFVKEGEGSTNLNQYFRNLAINSRVDPTDFKYRSFHNIGHSLGFGHFYNYRLSLMRERVIRSGVFSAREIKSVMHPKITSPLASSRPTSFDVYSLRYIFENLDTLVNLFSQRVVNSKYEGIVPKLTQYTSIVS